MREAAQVRRIFFTRRSSTHNSRDTGELMIALAEKVFGAENSKDTMESLARRRKAMAREKRRRMQSLLRVESRVNREINEISGRWTDH